MPTCEECGAPLDEDGECVDDCWDDYDDEDDDYWDYLDEDD